MCTEGVDKAYLGLKVYLRRSRKEWKEIANLRYDSVNTIQHAMIF